MTPRQTLLPREWLVTDARNDARVPGALARLPRGSGLIVRLGHLPEAARRAQFDAWAKIARRFGHGVVLASDCRTARAWGAGGAYGPAMRLAKGPRCWRLVSAHSLREIAAGTRARADAILLSPVFPTASHPGAPTLGPVRFRLMAKRAQVPVIALGGMTPRRARALGTAFAAIDGLT